jgi:predicted deacylase
MRKDASILPLTPFVVARPTDKATIEYLIQVGNVLSGGMVNEDDSDGDAVEKGELLDSIMTALDMTESELTANIRRSILSTARQIIGVKYPEEHVVYAQVKKEHVKAVAG